MMEKIEKFLRETGERFGAGNPELELLSLEAKELHQEMTALMEVGVFKMEPLSGQEPHYDIAVSIKDGDGNIHEVEDFENVPLEEVEARLDELSAKYPHATVFGSYGDEPEGDQE